MTDTRISSNIDDILHRLPALEQTGKKLEAKSKFRDAAAEVLKGLQKQKERLERLKRKDGDWKGNNNPALQFAKTYGVQQHDRMNSDNRCNLYDKSGFPGLGRDRSCLYSCVDAPRRFVIGEGKGRANLRVARPRRSTREETETIPPS